MKPIKLEEEADYVVRQDLEALLNDIVGTIYDRKYIILVGEGSGKTTLLNHVVNGKKGIVSMQIGGKTTLQNMEQNLLKSIGVSIESSWNQDNGQQVFGEICSSVRQKEGNRVKWVPTIIFEVEGCTPKEMIERVYNTAKQLTSDKVQARCIIVLSDANASLEMTYEPERQRYIWIPDFTVEEANTFLTKLGFTDDQEIRKMIIDKIGTRPMGLRNIATSKMSPTEFIEKQIRENELSIKKTLIKDPGYKDLLIQMMKDEYKNGIGEMKAMDLCKVTTNDIAEGPAGKEFQVLSYDIQNGRFQFHSRSMYHAAKRSLKKSTYDVYPVLYI
jgi:AAA+ ATPase superfamily predicted ATPase